MRTKKKNPELDGKVVGYIRVSSLEQANDGISLERQADQIKAYCALKGIKDFKLISDKGLSGFKSNRPGFQELLELCHSKQVKMVIVYDLSRLSRSVRDTLAFVEDVIQKRGIQFVSLQNDIDTTTPMGSAFLRINAVFNQLYRDEISFKTKEALRHKRGKGEKTGGVIPFGYRLVGESRLVPLPKEIEIIRHIHQLRKKGFSLREIIGTLESKGIKTKTGKDKWNPKVVRQILERQLLEITHDPEISDQEKDCLLEDVVGAIYETKRIKKISKKTKQPMKMRIV
jgi:site-specific DNA recombinase